MRTRTGMLWGLIATLAMLATLLTSAASAHPDPDDGDNGLSDSASDHPHPAGDLSEALVAHDASTEGVVSAGPSAKTTKNITARSIGARDVDNATTDVWAHDGYAYTGTFNSPCGGDPDAGVWVWDVSNKNNAQFVTVIPSPPGARSNDVRVASMNAGDILVLSNEPCASGGPGGFEVWNVDDPTAPVHLASVQTDDVNEFLRDFFGFEDFGVHNLFLFTQGEKDYVAATVESLFGNFQIFDLANLDDGPVGFWGAESTSAADSPFPSPHPTENYATLTDFGKILDSNDYLFGGFGASSNRFLHDVTISADGTQAYLANWDAGLVLLDISDVSDPTVVSVAIDPTSQDGEVNSHSVWPSEDGTIVIEGEEDFAPYAVDEFLITSGTHQGAYPSGVVPGAQAPAALPDLTLNGPVVYGGYGCPDSAPVPSPGDIPGYLGMIGPGEETIVVLQRGPEGDPSAPEDACFPGEKAHEAVVAGWDAVLFVQRHDASEDPPFCGSGAFVDAVVGICTNHEAFHRLFDTPPFTPPWTYPDGPAIGAVGDRIEVGSVFDGWSGFRIWDYSDPTAPELKSTFDTLCATTADDPSCDPAGTYSAHNVIVETTGNKVKAYISWYSDGMLVVDITDPANPVEVGRYTEPGTDFWGVYKEPNSPFFYGSDRNGGLYVFKEQGSGSGKAKGKP